jgi:predicted signal transduction protein with EAL and GGDEF domain
MKPRHRVRRWFYLGSAKTPAGRALLVEQFRILTSQIPVLYGVLIVDSLSIAYVLPTSLPFWLRFITPAALILGSAARLTYWMQLRSAIPTAEQALAHLFKIRVLCSVVNLGFSVWTLARFENLDAASRAAVALVVFMGSVGSAYCLGSVPSAAWLTLLLSALPISLRLMLTATPCSNALASISACCWCCSSG